MARDIQLPLQNWYPSEGAKRSFGSICQRVNESGGFGDLLGTPECPLLSEAMPTELNRRRTRSDQHRRGQGGVAGCNDSGGHLWHAVPHSRATDDASGAVPPPDQPTSG